MSTQDDRQLVTAIKRDLVAFTEAHQRLAAAGVIRTNNPVGDFGEWVAARYYGVDLAPARTKGFDLTNKEGFRVQVKTLRDGNSGRRYEVGAVKGPYDLLLMIRLAPDYTPLKAAEVERKTIEAVFGDRVVRWSQKFEDHPDVRVISAEELAY